MVYLLLRVLFMDCSQFAFGSTSCFQEAEIKFSLHLKAIKVVSCYNPTIRQWLSSLKPLPCQDFPEDPTGRLDDFKDFVKSNLKIFKIIGFSIVLAQVFLVVG